MLLFLESFYIHPHRSFNKVFILFLPIILSPYFVYLGKESKNVWQPYYMAILVAFVFR